jgi:hypothetical protein
MEKPVKLSMRATIHKIQAEPVTVTIIGRDGWALLSLIGAGRRGCTPITRPAPRWSHYVWKLRGSGINVETIHEAHGGSFSGSHARYVLHDTVTVSGGTLDVYLASPEGRREFAGLSFARAA